jgi:probable rRNA maturation factor
MNPSPRRQPAATLSIDIVRESPLWQAEPDSEQVLRRAIAEAAAGQSTKGAELAIVLTDDSRLRALNRVWRGIDKPTNVLSFPAKETRGNGLPMLLGDIVIAYETVATEAAAQGKPFLHHLAHLAVHGFLHLRGYDHIAEKEADTMERLERAVLARLDMPDPYVVRDSKPD